MQRVADKVDIPTVGLGSKVSFEFLVGLGLGITASGLVYLVTQLWRYHKARDRWSNKQVKQSVLELVGNTPMLKLATLSRVLGNEFFVALVSTSSRWRIKIPAGAIRTEQPNISWKT